jgi:membrane fusion protein, type I secretion system
MNCADREVAQIFARQPVELKARQQNQADEEQLLRVQFDETDVHKKIGDFNPTPGMPADVYIKTGERAFFEYMLRPDLDGFSRAFRAH